MQNISIHLKQFFFKKGSNLYNLDLARKLSNKQDHIYLVEGYMDVVGLNKNGIDNVVAKHIVLIPLLLSNSSCLFYGNPPANTTNSTIIHIQQTNKSSISV